MSRTNCLRPSSGFCLNLRVRMVNSTMASTSNIANTQQTEKQTNPLLGRKQFVLDIIHPGLANVSKKDLAAKLASR